MNKQINPQEKKVVIVKGPDSKITPLRPPPK